MLKQICRLEKFLWSSRRCFVEETAFWIEDLEEARWVKGEMSWLVLHCPRSKAIEKTGKKLFKVREGSGVRREKEEERWRGLALLTMLIVFSARRKRMR